MTGFFRQLERVWVPLVLVVAVAVSGLAIYRMHGIFGSQNANASRGGGSCPITLDRACTIVDGPWRMPAATTSLL